MKMQIKYSIIIFKLFTSIFQVSKNVFYRNYKAKERLGFQSSVGLEEGLDY
jgi:hypothetical protein